jgi:hypothetical protein
LKESGFGLPEILVVISIVIVIVAGGWLVLQEQGQQGAGSGVTLVEITDAGSTNFTGWSLKLYTDGSGRLTCDSGPQLNKSCTSTSYRPGTFPAASLAHDLADTNLQSYKSACIASASFGSVETLIYNGKRTRGIDCYAESAHTPLANDLTTVFTNLDVQG